MILVFLVDIIMWLLLSVILVRCSMLVWRHCCCRYTKHEHYLKLYLGLDRYRAGARYPILSAAAAPIPILIPILEMTSHIAWGMHTLYTLCIAYVCFKT